MSLALSTGTGTGLVERKQTVSGTIGSGASSVDLTIDNVDLTRAVLDPSYSGGTNTPSTSNVNFRFVDSNTVRAERDSTGTAVDVVVIVTEFASQVSVQNVYNTSTTGNATDTINNVNLATTICRMNGMERAGGSVTDDDCNRMSLSDSTTVAWNGGDVAAGQIVAGQVIDFGPGCRVQSGFQQELGASTIKASDATIARVETENTFVMATMETGQSAPGFQYYLWNVSLLNSTTVRFERNQQANYDYEWDWFVVEFDPGIIKVQRGSGSMASLTSSVSITLDALDLEKSSVRMGSTFNGVCLSRTDDADDDSATTAIRAELDDDTTLTLTRSGNSQTTYYQYEVMEWLRPLGPSSELLAGPIAGAGAGGGDIEFGPETAAETATATLDGVTITPATETASESASATLDPVQFSLGVETGDEAASAVLDGVTVTPEAQTAAESATATLDPITFSLDEVASEAATASLTSVTITLAEQTAAQSVGSSTVTERLLEDYYPFENQSSETLLGPSLERVAQMWEGQGNQLTGAAFWIRKIGAPVGTISCKLYAVEGSYGTTSEPVGSALATSVDTIDEGDLISTYQRFQFTFDYTLSDSTYYALSIEAGAGSYSAGNGYYVATDNTTPTHPGNYAIYFSGQWIGTNDTDVCFEALVEAPSEDISVTQTAEETATATLDGVTITLAAETAAETATAFTQTIRVSLPSYTISELDGSATLDSPIQFSLNEIASESATATLDPVGVQLGELTATESASSDFTGDSLDINVEAGDTATESATATLVGVVITLPELTASEAATAEATVQTSEPSAGDITLDEQTATISATATVGEVRISFVEDEYDEPNADLTVRLGYDGSGGARDGVGQSFTGNGGELYKAKFWLVGNDTGSPPAATISCNLYQHSGIFGSSSVPGTLIATATTTYQTADIATDAPYWLEFEFADGVTLADGTNYCIELATSAYTSTGADFIALVSFDGSTPTHPGNYFVCTPPIGAVPYNSVRTTADGSKSDLDGATISSTVFIEFEINGSTANGPIQFYLNGVLYRTENNPPYDFNGGSGGVPVPWDSSEVVDGSHTIEAFYDTGVVTSTFTVDNAAGPGPDPDPDPPPPDTVETITMDGNLTVSFDANVTSGQYLDDSYWVVGPVGVTGHSGTGAEIDPVYAYNFGLDPRKWYEPTKHFFQGTIQPTKSLVVVYERLGTPESATGVPRPYLARGAPLTVVDAQPPANSFRPSYAGVDKTHYTLPANFSTIISSLPKFSYTTLDVEALIVKHKHMVGPSLRAGYEKRWFQFGDWHADYSRELCSEFGVAACQLLLDIPDEQKERLAKALIQVGIDYYGQWQSGIAEGFDNGYGFQNKGQLFSWDGGIGSGRKFPIVLAGHLLDNATLRDFYKNSVHPNRTNWFHEDRQTWINDGVSGDQVWYTAEGMTSGSPAWRENNVVTPPGNTSYFTCCTANAWAPQFLVLKALGLEAAWDHDVFFSYEDLYVDTLKSSLTWERIWSDWGRGFWDAYRPTLA